MATETRTQERVVPLEGVHNFRDYGGYAAAGGRLKSGLLYRSAQHFDATDADLARIADVGLVTVIDLRGGAERASAPCRRPDGFSAQVFFVDEDTAGLALHMEAARVALTPEQAREAMVNVYRQMPFRSNLRLMLRRYFEVLATIPGPSLIHCMAGKDRTGLAVALLQASVGVHRDDLLGDYLMTNTAGRVEERIAAGARHIRAAYGDEIGDPAIRVLMSVEPAYMDAAFSQIDERYGSLDVYLRDELGVTDERRAAIAAHLVE